MDHTNMQYRITTADFMSPGETGDADAIIDQFDLSQIKKMAGISGLMQSAITNGPTPKQTPSPLREVKYESAKKMVI
jgi:hypothetical protein